VNKLETRRQGRRMEATQEEGGWGREEGLKDRANAAACDRALYNPVHVITH
jgi:hypothetical protein